MSSGVVPETCTKLLDTSGGLGTREHDQDLEMFTWGHSGKYWLLHFCCLPWCVDWLCSQGRYDVITAHSLSVTANHVLCMQKIFNCI